MKDNSDRHCVGGQLFFCHRFWWFWQILFNHLLVSKECINTLHIFSSLALTGNQQRQPVIAASIWILAQKALPLSCSSFFGLKAHRNANTPISLSYTPSRSCMHAHTNILYVTWTSTWPGNRKKRIAFLVPKRRICSQVLSLIEGSGKIEWELWACCCYPEQFTVGSWCCSIFQQLFVVVLHNLQKLSHCLSCLSSM